MLYAHTFAFWKNMTYELFSIYIKYLFCQTHCCAIYENNAIEEDPARIRFLEFKLHCIFEAWSQRPRLWLIKIYIYEIAKNQRLFWTSPSLPWRSFRSYVERMSETFTFSTITSSRILSQFDATENVIVEELKGLR